MSTFNEVNPVKGILCSGHVIKYLLCCCCHFWMFSTVISFTWFSNYWWLDFCNDIWVWLWRKGKEHSVPSNWYLLNWSSIL